MWAGKPDNVGGVGGEGSGRMMMRSSPRPIHVCAWIPILVFIYKNKQTNVSSKLAIIGGDVFLAKVYVNLCQTSLD